MNGNDHGAHDPHAHDAIEQLRKRMTALEKRVGTNQHKVEPLELAIMFHHTYEQLAPSEGYSTRPDTRTFDPRTPNGKLMVAVCTAILAQYNVEKKS